MVALASIGDLEARWRPLTTAEDLIAPAWLDTASAIVRQRTNVDALLADTDFTTLYPDYENAVIGIVAAMVLRVLRNPDGLRSYSIDDFAATRDTAVSTGLLYLSEDEASILQDPRSPTGAFTIRAAAVPGYRTDSDDLDWS